MNPKTRELLSLLENNEVVFIDTSDKRAINMDVRYNKKKVLCFGVIVPKESTKDFCDYYWDKSLGLYLKGDKNE